MKLLRKIPFLALVIMLISTTVISTSAANYPRVEPVENNLTAKPHSTVELKYTIYHVYAREKITTVIYTEDGGRLGQGQKEFTNTPYSSDYSLNWYTEDYPAGKYKAVSVMSYHNGYGWVECPNSVTVYITIEGEQSPSGTSIENAIELEDGKWHTRMLTTSNYRYKNYNKIVVPSKGYITFSINKVVSDRGITYSYKLNLFNKDEDALWSCDSILHTKESNDEYSVYTIGLNPGTYYMKIAPNFSVTGGTFNTTYMYKFTAADDWETEFNGSFDSAVPLTLGKTYNGVFGEEYQGNNSDYFSFDAVSGHTYTIELSNYEKLSLSNFSPRLVDSSVSSCYLGNGTREGSSNVWTFKAEKTGKHYFILGNASIKMAVDYTLTVTLKNHDYKLKTTKAATCTSEGKKEYVCSCGMTKGEPIVIAKKDHTIDKGTVTKKATYTSEGTKTYKCKVCKAVIKTEKIKKLTLPKVTKLKATPSATSIKFTWEKVTGAKKYEVYYSTNGKKWTKVTATKNSATVKKLKAGTTYKVKVRAISGKNNGAYSSVLTTSTTPATVTLSKVTAGSKQATLTWKTVTGATGYEVQYSTSSKFKNAKTATVKKSSSKNTTIKKLENGKTYYFKVRAYKTVNGKKIYGAWSSVKNVKVK